LLVVIYNTGGHIGDIYVSGEYICSAEINNGLTILKNNIIEHIAEPAVDAQNMSK